MSSVALAQVVIAAVSDLTSFVAAYSSGYAPQAQTSSTSAGKDELVGNGAVRSYANGRTRNIVVAGTRHTFSMFLEMVSYADAQRLAGWLNQTVLVRDSRGRKAYGVFNSVRISDWKGVDGSNDREVAITVTEITYSEAV